MVWKLEKRLRYATQEQDSENPRLKRTTFFIGPRHVKHHSTKEFVEFSYVTSPKFASEKDCRVFAQNSHVAIEIYDFYAKLFDPDYENVSVYDERFDVQYLFKTKPSETWRSVDYYNPTIEVISLEDGVEIKKTFDTDYGTKTLEISYIVRTGRRLKHNIKFTNKTMDSNTFRVVMKLAGITNTKVTHKDGMVEITKETKIGAKPFFFIGEDNQHLRLTEYLWSLGVTNEETGEWTATTLQDIVFDVHAQGCKADIIIGNYTLGENESLLIDPTTSTWQVGASSDDCRVVENNTYFDKDISEQWAGWRESYTQNWSSGQRFTSVNIPQGSTINSAYLRLKGRLVQGTADTKIEGEDTDNAATFVDRADWDARVHTTASVAWHGITGWSDGTWYDSPDIKAVIQEIINRPGWSSGNALVLFWMDDGSVHGEDNFAIAYNYDDDPADAPKLEVTWTPPAPPPPIEENPLISKPLACHIKVGKPIIR